MGLDLDQILLNLDMELNLRLPLSLFLLSPL
nr:hypothetical protein Q903MT_gene3245 [Picea sitchensis]